MNHNQTEGLLRYLHSRGFYQPVSEESFQQAVVHMVKAPEINNPGDILATLREFSLLRTAQMSDRDILAAWQESMSTETQSLTVHQARAPVSPAQAFGTEAAFAARAIGSHRQIQKKIGEGGMGVVLLALNKDLGRREVIKLMKGSDALDIARFRKEARAMARVKHPNVVQILEVGTNPQEPFLVLEFVQGETLKAFLQKQGPMGFASAFKLIRPAIAGVRELHRQGIVHRDLKPENLMIRSKDGELVVLDLGLAKQSGESETPVDLNTLRMSQEGIAHTQTGQVLGTPKFMAPEQAEGKVITPSTDTWAIGVILYEMLTGEHLNQGVNMTDVLLRLLEHDFVALARERLGALGVPGFCIELVASCLERSPENRASSCDDLLKVIDGYFQQQEEARIASVERGIAAEQLLLAKQKRITQLLWAGVILALMSIGLVLFFAKAKSEAEKRVKAETQAREDALARVEAQAKAAEEAQARALFAQKVSGASSKVEHASQHIAEGRWEEAKTLLEGVVADFPEQRNARRLLTEVYDVLADPKRIEHSFWLARHSTGVTKQNYLLRVIMGVDVMDDTTVEAVNRQLQVADEAIAEMEGLHLDLAKIMRSMYATSILVHNGRGREALQERMRVLRIAGDFANVKHDSWETRFMLGIFQVMSAQLAWDLEPQKLAPPTDRLTMHMNGWERSFATMNEAARANPNYQMTLYFRQFCRRELARLIRLDTRLSQERRTLLVMAHLSPAYQDLERLEVLRPGSAVEALNTADCAIELAFPDVYPKGRRQWYVARALSHLASCEEQLTSNSEYAPLAERIYLVSAKAHALNWQLTEDAEARSKARDYLNRARSKKRTREFDSVYQTVLEMIQ